MARVDRGMGRVTTRWISMCSGLAATETRAMTGRFPPVSRMGGKRSVADHVLEIIGMGQWPRKFLMVDSDPAIVEFWQAAFGGWLPAAAQIIRDAPCDGEELWKLWMREPVPTAPVERLARWVVGQKGNFSGKPLSRDGAKWVKLSSYPHRFEGTSADRLDTFWEGVAGYASVSDRGREKGFKDRFDVKNASQRLDDFAAGPGSALLLDLATSSPVFRPGDLVTIDPPYQGTTGYGTGLDRARVVELAKEAHDCGCRVLVHEAEPVITGPGWWRVQLERRHGRKQNTWRNRRADGKKREEWATINWKPPVIWKPTTKPPAGQLSMF